MSTLYKGQAEARISIDTGVDLTGGTGQIIKYRKPNGATGSWPATISGTKLIHDVASSSELDVSGLWTAWPWLTFPDGRTAPGKPQTFLVPEEGAIS